MLLSSPHVHSTYCDGKSTTEEMVLSAIAHGFCSIGFSGHAVQRFDAPYCMSPEAEEAYRRSVLELQKKYSGQIRIWLGAEVDLFSCWGDGDYDYIIGSVHYLPSARGLVAIDGSRAQIETLLREEYGGKGTRMVRDYYRLYAANIQARRPLIGGHLDVIQKNNRDGALFCEEEPSCMRCALEAMRVMRECGTLLEINTGAMARSGAKVPYPSAALLKEWHRMGGEVIMSSDCHYAPQIMAGYPEAVSLLQAVGYREAWILGRGSSLLEPTPLDGKIQ